VSERAPIQTPYLAAEDEFELTLRPRRLEEFVGQAQLKEQLAVSIEAATARGEALDHVLLAGPPGLGKTSLAQIVAAELGVPFVQTAGPALERKGDIASFLTSLEPRSVFFVDEIHRLPRALEETFYPAMEDSRLPITVGQGAGARVVTLELPPFTLIGATTRAGLLTTPLRDRFGIQARLEPYSSEELAAIVVRAARILEVELDDAGAHAIASRSRGTPRVANRLLKRARDYAEVRGSGTVTEGAAQAALELLEVDELGLDRLDRAILRAICEKFAGGPVGLSTLAVAVGEERDTIEDVYEPYLLQLGMLKRTPRGRIATAHAYAPRGGGRPPPTPTRTSTSQCRRWRRRCSDSRARAADRSPNISRSPPVSGRPCWRRSSRSLAQRCLCNAGPHLPIAVMGSGGKPRVRWVPVHELAPVEQPDPREPQLRAFMQSADSKALAQKKRLSARSLSDNQPARGLPGLRGHRAHRTTGLH
jgi:Holliday junction DNA helicase RuvB